MAEIQNVKGKATETAVNSILEQLFWVKGGSNKDVISLEKSDGLDSFFSYTDPYVENKIGILVETKTRQMSGLNINLLQTTVDKMSEKIYLFPTSPDFQTRVNLQHAKTINTGLIALWVHDGMYNSDKYYDLLKKINIPQKGITQRIFIACNDELLKAVTIIQTLNQIKNEAVDKSYTICYPCHHHYSNFPKNEQLVTIEQLFSKYIFCNHTSALNLRSSIINLKNLDVLYFDDINIDALMLMYNALEEFQLLKDIDVVNVYCYKPLLDTQDTQKAFKKAIRDKKSQLGLGPTSDIDNGSTKQDIQILIMEPYTGNILGWSGVSQDD